MDDQPDPLETLQKYQPHGQPGNVGGGRYPVKTRSEMREIARLLTLANPKVRQRLNKEAENGTMPVPLFIELVRQGYGLPEQKVKVEDGPPRRPVLRTQRPIGWDPLNPENPNVRVIEATYGHLPALPAAPETEPADEPPAGEPEPAKGVSPQSIVPHPEIVKDESPGRTTVQRKRRKPPEDDATPLRVDGA